MRQSFYLTYDDFSTFVELILNFFIHYLNSTSFGELPVTPIIFFPKFCRYFFTTAGVSLSGSIDTNTIFSFRYAPSGKFLIILQTEEMQYKVLGEMSGQLVYPKYMRQQYPARVLLEKGLPSQSVKVQSPPTIDSLSFKFFIPEMLSSKKSSWLLFFQSAVQIMYMRDPVSIKNAEIPILLYPSQDTGYYQSDRYDFRSFCCCIIHAYYLFFGCLSFCSEKLQNCKFLRGIRDLNKLGVQQHEVGRVWFKILRIARAWIIIYNENRLILQI